MGKFFLVAIFIAFLSSGPNEFIERQGQITFFSYTSVENIQATNNQALSLFNPQTGEVAVSILMRAFIFKKALMHEHFNESYIESDLYPKATFEGKIIDFEYITTEPQTKLIKGDFKLKDKITPIEIKAKIVKTDESYRIEGKFDVLVSDYNINIPPLLSPNISNKINVSFNFNYKPYE